ncbi:MAG TPA: vitamin K epoxide reductase family protein [Solirubrobacteraceae bacterium]|nr:vitamin K epoxide reductase family protein [Solirubrobacteraceae bacterium]
MRFTLRRAMTVVALLGIALTIYLTIVHYAGLKPACTAGQSCIKVQTSQWSELAGVPVALIGLIGYILILGSLLAKDIEETRLATLGLTLIGFGFSVYLTYREGHSIHAYCEECLTSAAFMTVLFIAAAYRYVTTDDLAKAPPAPAALPPRKTKSRAAQDQPRSESRA